MKVPVSTLNAVITTVFDGELEPADQMFLETLEAATLGRSYANLNQGQQRQLQHLLQQRMAQLPAESQAELQPHLQVLEGIAA